MLSRTTTATTFRYTPETHAAWYALSPFINPIDCSHKITFTDDTGAKQTLIVPLNRSDDLNRFYNHESLDGAFFRPSFFSRKRLQTHLQGREVYYYRSKCNGIAKRGFGNSPKSLQRIGFDAAAMGVTGKSWKYPYVGVMLLCADIDCHHGEGDVSSVVDWLLDAYFPGCYYEPSTNGQGLHLYIKLAYNPWHRRWRDATIEHVVTTINRFSSLLDRQRQENGFDAPVDKLSGLPSLFRTEGNRLCLKRSRCIKIPLFREGMPDILRFHFSPFFLFSAIERWADASIQKVQSAPDLLINNALELDPTPGDSPKPCSISGVSKPLNSVSPSYAETLNSLRQETDAFDRSMSFLLAFSRFRRHVPSVDEALAEYQAQGLGGSDDDADRRQRFKYQLQHIAKTFDYTRLAFNYERYEREKDELIGELQALLTPEVCLSYKKAAHRNTGLTIDDLSVLLFAMRKSQGTGTETRFSYAQVNEAFRQITGRGCGTSKASALLKALTQMGLIQRVGNYCVGVAGNLWRVKPKPSQTATQYASRSA